MIKWLKSLFKPVEKKYAWESKEWEGSGCNESACCDRLPRPTIPERRGSPLTAQKAVENERRKNKETPWQ